MKEQQARHGAAADGPGTAPRDSSPWLPPARRRHLLSSASDL